MPITDLGKNNMLVSHGITHISAWTGDPLNGGAEVIGGGYSRKAITFLPPADGVIAQAGAVVFNLPANAKVDFIAYMNSVSLGEVLSYDEVTPIYMPNEDGYMEVTTGQVTILDVV